MEGDDKRKIQFKSSLVLNRFLEENKLLAAQNEKAGKADVTLVDNLSKLASATGLRPATISSIFNADSSPSTTNLILIVNKLDRLLSEFGREFEKVSDEEAEKFESQIAIKKALERKRKLLYGKN
jgi:transcriptional regulator with XRE-family HTH domain